MLSTILTALAAAYTVWAFGQKAMWACLLWALVLLAVIKENKDEQ